MSPITLVLLSTGSHAYDVLPLWVKVILVGVFVVLGVSLRGWAYDRDRRRWH